MPIPVYDSLEAAVRGSFGDGVFIESRTRVGGGGINDACIPRLSVAKILF